jgi:hypothetical protein
MGKIVGTLGLRFPSTIAKQNRVELLKKDEVGPIKSINGLNLVLVEEYASA